MWLTQVCPWNLSLEVSVPFCRTWCICGEFHVADSDVTLESSVPFYGVWWTVSFMWLTQVCPWNLSLEMCIPFCRTWWTVSFMWLTQMCSQNTKLEEHPWRCLYLSTELANSEFHVDDSGKLRDVCTFLQNLVNSEFPVAHSGVSLEVSVPFYRTWWTVCFPWLTQACPWRFLYLSTELGEQPVSCCWLRCVLGGFCTFLQNLVNSVFPVADSGVSLEVSVPFYKTWWTVSFLWLTQVCSWRFSVHFYRTWWTVSFMWLTWRYQGWFMVAVQHRSRVGFLDTGLQKACFMAGVSFRLYSSCYIAQSWLTESLLHGCCVFQTLQHLLHSSKLAYRKLASWLLCLSDFTAAVT